MRYCITPIAAARADLNGRRNTDFVDLPQPRVKCFCGRFPTQRLSRPGVEDGGHGGDLLHGMTLYPEKRNLLALHRRQIPPRERLCRGSEHRWWHAARLSEPSGSYRLRHTGFERSIFAAQTSGDPQPKSTLFIAPRHGGRPGDGNGARPDRSDRRFRMLIATSNSGVLRRPFESAQYTSEQFQRLMADDGIVCSISRAGDVWDNAAMESFFSWLKTERMARNRC